MTKLHVDIETYSSKDLKSTGVYPYAESIDFEILMISYAFDDEPVEIVDLAMGEKIPERLDKGLRDSSIKKYAVNAPFERRCLRVLGYETPSSDWRCMANKASYCGLPRSLEDISDALNLGDKGKSAEGKALIRYFSMPCKPSKKNGHRRRNLPKHDLEKWNRFKEYCKQDTVAEREIAKTLSPYEIPWFDYELYDLDQEINERGVLIDMDLVDAALAIDGKNSTAVIERMKEISGLENPGSVAQLKEWLTAKLGRPVTSLTKGSYPELIEEASRLPDPEVAEEVTELIELRQKSAKAAIKKYIAMKNCVARDGRAHGLFQYYGASRTGRWSGRLIQLQNLFSNTLKGEALGKARDMVKAMDFDKIEFTYGDVADLLAQLIRTALVAPEGKTFAVADFSAIEARVIAWLAGEEWRIKLFEEGGDIYVQSYAQMMKVNPDTVDKQARKKGKIAELACGYQGGVGALKQMGGEAMGLSEGEMKLTVNRWRQANPNIQQFWKRLEGMAKTAISKPGNKIELDHGIYAIHDGFALRIGLPSGRELFYKDARIVPGEYGVKIQYKGKHQKTKQWVWLETYGGKLAENCLAADTEVLTNFGWKRIVDVSSDDMLWDGVEWVSHEGVIAKGVKTTMDINGVRMTGNHKILTDEGWKNASQSEGSNRKEDGVYYGEGLSWLGWQKVAVENEVRLRTRILNARVGIHERKAKVMRVHERGISTCESENPRDDKSSGLCGMAINDRQMQVGDPSSLEKLRRERYIRGIGVGAKLRGVLGGYGADVSERFDIGQDGQQRELHERELSMGNSENAVEKQTIKQSHPNPVGADDSIRSLREVGGECDHAPVSAECKLPKRQFVRKAGRTEQVFDIKNSGPRNRFVVRGIGFDFIVHNCTQAVARDILAYSMLELKYNGFEIVIHVHDEAIAEVTKEVGDGMLKLMKDIMAEKPDWAEGLPLNAEGYVTDYYYKD